MTLPQFEARLAAMRASIPGVIRRSLVEVGNDSVKLLKTVYLTNGLLNVRSGLLRGSVGMEVVPGSDGPSLVVFAGRSAQVKYARIHEVGGTITPKRGKFLAIPVGPARTAAGVARFSSPRQVPDLHYVQSRKGQPMLVKLKGKGRGKRAGAIEVWYILRRQVTIKPKHYMAATEVSARSDFPGVLAANLARVLA